MKKSIAITVMALGTLVFPLAGCSGTVASSNVVSSSAAASSSLAASSSAESSSAVSSSSSVDPLMAAAQGATKMLNFDAQTAEGMTTRTFVLNPIIDYSATYQFQVNYTIAQQTVYDGASATIFEDTDPDNLNPDYRCSMVAPYKDPENAAKWIVFVLTAHLIYNGTPAVVDNAYYGYTGQEVLTADFNIRVDPISYVAIKDIPNLTSGAALATYGYYIGKYANSTAYCWVADGDAAITAYAPSNSYSSLSVGSVVKVIGSYSPYSGLPELKSGCSVTAATLADAQAANIDITAPTTLTWDGTYALQAKDCSRQIALTCTVTSIAPSSTSTNVAYYISVGSVTSNLEVYLQPGYVSAAIAAEWTSVKVGDTLNVTGWISYYAPIWEIVNPTIVP